MNEEATPRVIEFNPDDLTLGEIEDIEEACGMPFQKLIKMFEKEELSTIGMRAVMWVIIRRGEPDYTFENAKDLTIRDLDELELVDEEGKPAGPLAAAPSGDAA